MTETKAMTCPTCSGQKRLCALQCAPSEGKSTAGYIDCFMCGGQGVITAEHANRAALGDEIRERRLGYYMTLHDLGQTLGMKPSELSDLERGRNEDVTAYERVLREMN